MFGYFLYFWKYLVSYEGFFFLCIKSRTCKGHVVCVNLFFVSQKWGCVREVFPFLWLIEVLSKVWFSIKGVFLFNQEYSMMKRERERE